MWDLAPGIANAHPGYTTSPAYFPAALRSASLMRSCQPGPPAWKYSSTSWSIRKVTCSRTPGAATFFGGGASATLAVAFFNAASAAVRASFNVRGRLGVSAMSDSFEQIFVTRDSALYTTAQSHGPHHCS